MGPLLRKNGAMEDLCNELLGLVLKRLPLRDAVCARAVCRRWRERIDADKAYFQSGQSYCPLVFKRTDDRQHTWSGYDSATGQWEQLPSLSNVPRIISLFPMAGSGNGLLGFKIVMELSGYIVGNPYSGKWKTLNLADDWGDAAMFMASDGQDGFRIVAVHEDTHIYNSDGEVWMKVGRTPPKVFERQSFHRIKNKICTAICNDRLYFASADGDALISFDMRTEQWTNERINIPGNKWTKGSMQLLECAGTVYAVTEDNLTGRVAVWGLEMEVRRFSLTVEMPLKFQEYLKQQSVKPDARGKKADTNLRSVGHGQHLFLWRNKTLSIVSYDLITQEWFKLPEIKFPEITQVEAGQMKPQITIDAGFFEPCLEPVIG